MLGILLQQPKIDQKVTFIPRMLLCGLHSIPYSFSPFDQMIEQSSDVFPPFTILFPWLPNVLMVTCFTPHKVKHKQKQFD